MVVDAETILTTDEVAFRWNKTPARVRQIFQEQSNYPDGHKDRIFQPYRDGRNGRWLADIADVEKYERTYHIRPRL